MVPFGLIGPITILGLIAELLFAYFAEIASINAGSIPGKV